jgi:peptidyl-prolyl cis-trans isomerase A (cyclophilin A)
MRLCVTAAGLTLACAVMSSAAFAQQGSSTAKPQTQKPASAQAPAGKPGATTQKPAPKPAPKPAAPKPSAAGASLRNPSSLKETAPATYNVNFATTAGNFVVQVNRAWAPKGADRFYNLVKNGYYNNTRFFRVVPNFMVQFGINGDPKIQEAWRDANISDDPVTQTNRRGYITFATRGANSRTTQVFINFKDNSFLDQQGFAPFGQVISGMEIVDKINAEYRERPDQGRIQFEGNAYLAKEFPRLDVMKSVTIARPAATAKPPAPAVKK